MESTSSSSSSSHHDSTLGLSTTQLLQPELLSTETLTKILISRGVMLNNTNNPINNNINKRLSTSTTNANINLNGQTLHHHHHPDKHQLIELYTKFILPKPQRTYKHESRRREHKKLLQLREQYFPTNTNMESTSKNKATDLKHVVNPHQKRPATALSDSKIDSPSSKKISKITWP